MDAQGPEVARRFTEAAGATFINAVDRAQGLWELYGFDVVPNGFFVDEQGVLRFVKIGGFEARNPEDVQAIEKLLSVPSSAKSATPAPGFHRTEEVLREAEEDARRDPDNVDRILTLAERRLEAKQYSQARREFELALEKDHKSARAWLGLATVALDLGEREKALAALKQAWALDPGNWILHKQIWAIEHPDQFYPAINKEWQKEQIQKEEARK